MDLSFPEIPEVGRIDYVRGFYGPDFRVREIITSGDLPYLEFLLDQYEGDLNKVKSRIYKRYSEIGRLEDAKKVEEKLKKGLAYSARILPEIKEYLRKNLLKVGLSLERDISEIEMPEILPLYLPSWSREINRKGKSIYEFKGTAAAATRLPPVIRYRAGKNFLLLGNLPLAYMEQEDVDDIALHEFIHFYLFKLGIPEELQQKLEPLIDKTIVEFYENKGMRRRAEKIKKNSAYLNQPPYIG